jgi:hypothetical protein
MENNDIIVSLVLTKAEAAKLYKLVENDKNTRISLSTSTLDRLELLSRDDIFAYCVCIFESNEEGNKKKLDMIRWFRDFVKQHNSEVPLRECVSMINGKRLIPPSIAKHLLNDSRFIHIPLIKVASITRVI